MFVSSVHQSVDQAGEASERLDGDRAGLKEEEVCDNEYLRQSRDTHSSLERSIATVVLNRNCREGGARATHDAFDQDVRLEFLFADIGFAKALLVGPLVFGTLAFFRFAH